MQSEDDSANICDGTGNSWKRKNRTASHVSGRSAAENSPVSISHKQTGKLAKFVNKNGQVLMFEDISLA